MRHLFNLYIFSILTIGSFSSAQEAPPAPWQHESEAAIVQVGGNTKSESFSAKQKTTYQFEKNIYVANARYLRTKSASIETARQWDASLRYERELSPEWSVFIQHGAESDPYAGYTQRDNTDLGGKYFFIKKEEENFFSEFGYRASKTQSSINSDVSYANSGRLYLEYGKKINESVTGKLWAEYLPNFTDSDAYLVNYEPSLSVMMSQVLSIKLAYLVKYHNKIAVPGEEKTDTTFTTALVAKF